jgi:prepilin-type N-terminal cleavage/methylation domain-containing protein
MTRASIPGKHQTGSITGKHQTGFTLLELLVVVAIIATLAAIGFNSFAEYQQTQRLNTARTELAVAIERIRQYTRRYNVSYTIKFNADGTYASTTKDSSGTAITQIDGPPVTVLPQISGKLPTGMTFSVNASGAGLDEVTYTAPFGRNDATKDCVGIALSAMGRTFGQEIHIVGVTGKVMSRPINTNQTTALCGP